MMIPFQMNDGGRSAAGFRGEAGDCVTRSIAIATGLPYRVVYDDLMQAQKDFGATRRCKQARAIQKRGHSPRNGVHKKVIREYLTALGWEWTPTMQIGQGCKVHLRADELPAGRLIVSVSRHMCAVIDGVLNDTYDCSRDGTRCVYGYWRKA